MKFFPRFQRHLLTGLLAIGLAVCAGATEKEKDHSPEEMQKRGVMPKPISRQAPIYPFGLVRSGIGGRVTVDFVIDPQGRVVNPVVFESNNPLFERPAIDAILKWKFKPGTIDGQPVHVRARQLLEFDSNMPGGTDSLWSIKKSRQAAKLPPELQWDVPPTPVATVFPVYPFEDLQAGTKGVVKLSFLIAPTGRVTGIKVHEATTPAMALAVQGMYDAWKFTPPRKKDGTICYANVGMDLEFHPAGDRGDVPVTTSAKKIMDLLEKKPEKIVPLAQLDRVPPALSRRPPVYPSSLLAASRPGEAVVEFFIDEEGDAQLPRVVSASEPEFGAAATQAVAAWRFEVPRRAGKAVVVRARIPLSFHPAEAAETAPKA